jgi:hypothetical protein
LAAAGCASSAPIARHVTARPLIKPAISVLLLYERATTMPEAAAACKAGHQRHRAGRSTQVKGIKVFWFFFSKKNKPLFHE